MPSQNTTDYTVRFSSDVARVIEYIDATSEIKFTLDSGDSGGKSICLEHHPSDWPRTSFYNIAFMRVREYLETCGYEVEIYGE